MQPEVFGPNAKTKIREQIINLLYEATDKQFQKRVDLIADQQYNLIGKTKAFFYGYQTFTHSNDPGFVTAHNLHHTLIPEFREALKMKEGASPHERVRIISFISALLNKCSTPKDLKLLIPENCAEKVLSMIPDHGWVFVPTLSDNFVTTFKQTHQLDYELVNERLMLNVILG